MKNYISIARYTYEHEIFILKHQLEKAGIPYIFKNETAVSMLPFHSNALGGIILQVPEVFVEATQKIISDLQSNNSNLKIVE